MYSLCILRISCYFSYTELTNVDGTIPVLRNRSKINEHQKSILERSFAVQCYPNKTSLKELSPKTGLRESQLLAWFSNNRQKKRLSKYVGRSSLL